MVISQEQFGLFEDTLFREYQRRLIAFYRVGAPEFMSQFKDEKALQRRVASAIQRGRSFGLTTAEGLLQYVGLALAAGSAFDDDPAVVQLMTISGSAPEAKLRRLLQFVMKQLHIIDMERLSG